MDKQTVLELLSSVGAVITGSHFVYTKKAAGWYHGSDYVNKDAFDDPIILEKLGTALGDLYWNYGQIQAVVCPAIGAVRLAHIVARVLSQYFAPNNRVRDYFAEKEGDGFILKRGFAKKIAGKNVLVVEDVITSGGSVSDVAKVVREAGGNVVAMGALCNRSGGKVTRETLDVPMLHSLLDLDMPMYPEESCPICKEKGPRSVRTDLGHGEDFLKRMGLPQD